MNTPAHLIFGAFAFSRPDSAKITVAAIVGALIPDFSLYFLVAWSRFVQGISFDAIFDTLYFSPKWQQIFAIDNSFFVWILVLTIGILLKKPWVWALAGAAILHLILDFPLHHDDARMHFWPLTTWVFESPVSYWDGNHYGNIVGPIEIGAALVCTTILLRRFVHPGPRVLFATLATLEAAPMVIFYLMFRT